MTRRARTKNIVETRSEFGVTGRPCSWQRELIGNRGSRIRQGEKPMRHLFALAFFVVTLLLGFSLTACSNDDGGVSNDYYENNVHHGYPGPGTQTPGSY
jgi:hypothetical protein